MEDTGSHKLAADVGGTNTRVAIFDDEEAVHVFHFKTQEIMHLHTVLNDVMRRVHDHEGICVSEASIAAAGRVNDGRVILTNTDLVIDEQEILQNTMLATVHLINDVQAAAYAINLLNPVLAPQILLAPGTGLGRATLYPCSGELAAHPSEGGHVLAPPLDLELLDFFGRQTTWEDLLSGRGLAKIHAYHTGKNVAPHQVTDGKSWRTYTYWLAKYCQHVALESLPTTIHLWGNIVNARPQSFGTRFRTMFEAGPHKDYLKTVDIEIITDELLALRGALFALHTLQ